MSMLISDTNIIADLHDGGLLSQMFRLEFEFAVPDILYNEEIKDYYPELEQLALSVLEMSSESITKAVELIERYSHTGVSVNDCLALTLAMQENCPLLTGDKKLREISELEETDCKGTLWVMEQMVISGVIDCNEAEAAYESMKQEGSYLPWGKVKRQLLRLRG